VSEQIFVDVFENEIVLIDEVRTETFNKHPEAKEFLKYVEPTLQSPHEVRRSSRDERVMLYYRYEQSVLGGKWIVVVVKRIDRSFVSTFYATNKIKSGEIMWKK
jgi:hypothetical protein